MQVQVQLRTAHTSDVRIEGGSTDTDGWVGEEEVEGGEWGSVAIASPTFEG